MRPRRSPVPAAFVLLLLALSLGLSPAAARLLEPTASQQAADDFLVYLPLIMKHARLGGEGSPSTPTPTVTASATSSATPGTTPSLTATATPSPTAPATVTPTPSPTASATTTATPPPTVSPSATATATETPTVTASPSPTLTPSPSATPTVAPTATATVTSAPGCAAVPLTLAVCPPNTTTDVSSYSGRAVTVRDILGTIVYQGTLNGEGRLTLPAVASGKTLVVSVAAGRQPLPFPTGAVGSIEMAGFTTSVFVSCAAPGGSPTPEVASLAPAAGVVQGYVINRCGSDTVLPAQEVQLWAPGTPDFPNGVYLTSAFTDIQGHFQFDGLNPCLAYELRLAGLAAGDVTRGVLAGAPTATEVYPGLPQYYVISSADGALCDLSPVAPGLPRPTVAVSPTIPPTLSATTGTPTLTPTPTGTPTVPPTPPPGMVGPVAAPGPWAFVPALGAADGGQAPVSSLVEAQNVGSREVQLAILYFDSGPTTCQTAPPPSRLECTGLIKPGAGWTFVSPPSALSAVVFSFDPTATSCQALQAFQSAPWPQGWPDVSPTPGAFPFNWNPFNGGPIAVTVRRQAAAEVLAGGPPRAAYRAVGLPDQSPYDPLFGGFAYSVPIAFQGADGATTTLWLQNSGTECGSFEVWLKSEDDCTQPRVFAGGLLPPGYTTRFSLKDRVPAGFVGAAWVRAGQPMSIAVDHAAPTTLMTDSAAPAVTSSSLFNGQWAGGGTFGMTLYAPLLRVDDGWQTRLHIHNPSSMVSAKIKLSLLDERGQIVTSEVMWVCPRGSVTYTVPSPQIKSARVESQEWDSPGDPFVYVLPITGIAEMVQTSGTEAAARVQAMSYDLLPAALASAVAIPLVDTTGPSAGLARELTIQNTVPLPGETAVKVMVADQNGVVEVTCFTLAERQVARLPGSFFASLPAGFRGQLLVVATASTHVPTGGGQPVVGLGAVYAEWAAGTDPPAGDWAFAMTGIPLPSVPTGLAAPACPTPSAP